MNQIKFGMTLNDVKNMDTNIDFYDIESTTKWGIDPLPMNKTLESFREILLQQTATEQDICNKKRILLENIRLDLDNASDSIEQETKTLFLKYITMEVIYNCRRNEIMTVLQNLAS